MRTVAITAEAVGSVPTAAAAVSVVAEWSRLLSITWVPRWVPMKLIACILGMMIIVAVGVVKWRLISSWMCGRVVTKGHGYPSSSCFSSHSSNPIRNCISWLVLSMHRMCKMWPHWKRPTCPKSPLIWCSMQQLKAAPGWERRSRDWFEKNEGHFFFRKTVAKVLPNFVSDGQVDDAISHIEF